MEQKERKGAGDEENKFEEEIGYAIYLFSSNTNVLFVPFAWLYLSYYSWLNLCPDMSSIYDFQV